MFHRLCERSIITKRSWMPVPRRQEAVGDGAAAGGKSL